MDCSLPGSSIHGIFQARLLEWGAIAFPDYMHFLLYKSANNSAANNTLLSVAYLLPQSLRWEHFISSIFRWRSWGTELFRKFSKAAQLVGRRAGSNNQTALGTSAFIGYTPLPFSEVALFDWEGKPFCSLGFLPATFLVCGPTLWLLSKSFGLKEIKSLWKLKVKWWLFYPPQPYIQC